ncbi:mhyt domain signaling [Zalerion maritima]|uniref:Mhyt domain signaling n=1 Tax=Zalerion maritima TaxID=339359 RepID=A0AAD5WR36_9PEZI|nr:mhyt domain signaling [Zalerion maritima]
MSTPEELFRMYEGQVVPRSFHYGFIVVSYTVSFIGAASTLELINRRTSPKGTYNHFLLFSSAVSMGGISIWCMHFIGNRAIDLANQEPELQISYSSGYTALSFFVPIVVLLLAFIATGTNNAVSWWRIVVGGVLAGNAICGMHYLGNASIENYTCVYSVVNIVGAAIIASVASIIALAVFFVFRATWNTSWWKRALCAVVLAGAVSGMHWCAVVGTQYRLKKLNMDKKQLSRNTTVIVVILLSVTACVIMAGTAIYTARVKRRYAAKAQQITLASAVFDKQGRILVNANGMVPSEVITTSFLETSSEQSFSVAHPLFHWMFEASRCWSGIANILSGMTNHLDSLPKQGTSFRGGIQLVNDHGETIEDYDLIFRELFCCAASSLADKLKEHLSQVGVLWDEILATGTSTQKGLQSDASSSTTGTESVAEKGTGRRKELLSNGSLMFLVKKVDTRHVEKLEAVGYRFADIRQVSPIIRARMQIRSSRVEEKLKNMSGYVDDVTMSETAVHLGFFGIKARVGSYGFDVLVRKGARNLLPSVPLPIEKLEKWQVDFICRLDGVAVSSLPKRLGLMQQRGSAERKFSKQLMDASDGLAAFVGDPFFDDALVTSRIVHVPCHSEVSSMPMACPMIVLRLVVPIHINMSGPKTELIPLSFFKIRQLMYKDSPYHAVFTRSVHREISPIINKACANKRPSPPSTRKTSGGRNVLPMFGRSKGTTVQDSEGNPIPTVLGRKRSGESQQSSSTLKLWDQRMSDEHSPPREPSLSDSKDTDSTQQRLVQPSSSFGGIMMTQEVTVHVGHANDPASRSNPGPQSPQSAVTGGAAARKHKHGHKPAGSGTMAMGHEAGDEASAEDLREIKTDGFTMIEMKPIPGSRLVTGATAAAAAEASGENLSDIKTFVDELFTICIGGHEK